MTSIYIPDSITYIDGSAFPDCPNLSSIFVDTGNEHYSSRDGVLFDKAQTFMIKYPEGKKGNYIIPYDVRSIRNWVFSGYSELESIRIPVSVRSLGL